MKGAVTRKSDKVSPNKNDLRKNETESAPIKSAPTHRILVMSHGHPDFSKGGAEIAAYNSYKAYKNSSRVKDAWFLARADLGRGPTGNISIRKNDEYLWEQSVFNWHDMKAVHEPSIHTWFADLVAALKPTCVHTHHYAHFGLEYLRIIKKVDPRIKIVMTLHEFMAICRNNGQMVKTYDGKLCEEGVHFECAKCFPDKSAEDFWLRKKRFLNFFDYVDHFISPSEFLRERYIEWGISESKISVIENGQDEVAPLPLRPLIDNQTRNRFGFFGQITPFKGFDLLLEALHTLPKDLQKSLTLVVNASGIEHHVPEFKEKIEKLAKPLIKRGVVEWLGQYQRKEVGERMSQIDWVVVPSIWWENSPMVIQEALSYKRPVITSNIGGMKEKVTDGVTGLHMIRGSKVSLANIIKRVLEDNALCEQLSANISAPPTHEESGDRHISIIELE